jgi:hypothetical protein
MKRKISREREKTCDESLPVKKVCASLSPEPEVK